MEVVQTFPLTGFACKPELARNTLLPRRVISIRTKLRDSTGIKRKQLTPPLETFNKSFNGIQVGDTGGWWRIVIDCAARSAELFAGEGRRGAIPTSASNR